MKSLEKDSKQTNINARSPTFNHASSAPGYHQSWMSNANSLFDKSSTNTSAAQKQKYVHTSDAYTRRSQSPIQSNRMQTSPHYSTSQFPFKAGRSISQGRIVTTGYISTTTTQGMETKESVPDVQPHNGYGPRCRAPYGQASHIATNPDQKEYREKLAEALSHRSRSGLTRSNSKSEKTGVQKPTHKKSHSSLYGGGPQQAKAVNMNAYASDSIQKDFWVGALNPYSRQGLSRTSIHSASGMETHFTSRHSGQAPLSIRKDSENLTVPGQTAFKRLISPKQKASYHEGNQSAHEHNSSVFSSGSRILNFLKTPPHNTNPFLTHTPGKFSSSPAKSSPASFRISTDSYAVSGRKRSVQDLVDQNLQKYEESMMMQKRAEEAGNANISGRSSYRAGSPDSKNQFLSTYRPSFGVNQTARNSIETNGPKSGRFEPSAYQVVVEHYSDNTKYEGEKNQGKRHGKGSFYYREGYKFEGDWQDDAMNGFGILWFDEKTKIYEGEWRNNLFHGRGTLFNHEPKLNAIFDGTDFKQLQGGWTKFEGVFDSGKKEGFGTLFIANGDIFVGTFARDVVHGRGSYTLKNGQKYIGLWRENILIQKF